MGAEGPLGGVRPICELKGSGHRLKPRPPSFASHCLTSDFSRLAVWPWGLRTLMYQKRSLLPTVYEIRAGAG